MKKILVLFTAALALLVTTAASAQTTIRVRTNIPFSFVVNRATLPPGEYSLESADSLGQVLMISGLNSKSKNLVITRASRSTTVAANTKLIFHRYGDSYFLNEIWVAGNDTGHELPASPREKEVAKDFSMENVVLVAVKR